MKIALVTDTYIPQVNGVTTVVRRQVELLRRSGAEVSVIAPAYPERGPADEVPTLRARSAPFPPYPAIRFGFAPPGRVARFLDAQSPDLVHVVTEGPLGLRGRRYALRRGLPLVTSYHTHFPRYCADYGVPRLEPAVWRWMVWFHRPASLVHTPGDEACSALRARGLPQAVVWGRGVDTMFFRPNRRDPAWRAAIGLAPDDVLILHVGRLAAEKNLGVLADAWGLVHDAFGGRAHFMFAGEGPEEARLRLRMPWARQLGFLGRAALAQLYANADLCVLPSTSETCGLVALEALASGLPVVAADAGGLRESVVSRANGLLVKPDDAGALAAGIVELALRRNYRQELSQAARRLVLPRDAAREDRELLHQYRTLIQAPVPEVACPAA